MSIKAKQVLDGAAAVAMIVASGAIIWMASSIPSRVVSAPAPSVRSAAEEPQPEPIDAAVLMQGATVKGQLNAKFLLVEFTDFQGPYCGQYAREVLPDVAREFVDTGQIRYVLRNYPLEAINPLAARAAAAANCAGVQGQYWQMHDRLFQNQMDLSQEGLLAHAEALGLTRAQFASCVDSYLASGCSESRCRLG